MARTVPALPEEQQAALIAAYNQAVAARRLQLVLGFVIFLFLFGISAAGAQIELSTLWNHFGNLTSYFDRLLKLDTGEHVWTSPADWFWGIQRWLRLLGVTMLIAYVGTLSGAAIAFLGCFFASRNLVRSNALRVIVRRGFEFIRTVPDLVFAMLFVVAFGIGPLPGVLTLALHSAGSLGKLFTEVVESVDMRPVEGVAATGGNWVSQIRFGVLPQVISNFVSYGLLRFEINVRSAAIIGFVGAGGIGQDLLVAIRSFYYSDVSAILVLIIACVMILDVISAHTRHHLLGLKTS